ncbi:MAG: tetratricopeptide repeat protein [Kiritimatiellia bacterium]|nr:tetratricopeptide repeat protein [Kiritimatiellia bacterium]
MNMRYPCGKNRGNRLVILLLPLAACVLVAALLSVRALLHPNDVEADRSDAPAPTEPQNSSPTVESLREEAFTVGRQAIKDFPNSTGPLIVMGKLYHQFGNRDEALKCWRAALKKNPRHVIAWSRMAEIEVENGNHEKAVELFRNALKAGPPRKETYQQLGQALLELGKPAEAVTALEAEIRHYPGTHTPHAILGEAFLQMKMYDKAVASYLKALEFAPHDSRSSYGLSIAYARLGQSDLAHRYRERFRGLREAERDQRRTKRQTRTADASLEWMSRAVAQIHIDASQAVYIRHRRPFEAERLLKRAASLDPKDQRCRQKLVNLYLRSQRNADAAAVSQELRALAPGNPVYHLNAGALLANLGQLDSAEEALREGIRLDPRQPIGYKSMALLLMHNPDKLSESMAAARKLVEIEPTAISYYTLCLACETNKDYAGAWTAIGKAREMDPGNEDIQGAHRRLQERPASEREQSR